MLEGQGARRAGGVQGSGGQAALKVRLLQHKERHSRGENGWVFEGEKKEDASGGLGPRN